MNAMKVRTVRQVKQQQQRPRQPQQQQQQRKSTANGPDEITAKPILAPKTYTSASNQITPPYRMPPQPQQNGTNSSTYSEAQIPGMTISNDAQTPASILLRTHSSKFPIERELILSSDKASSKIPLMHETRTPSGVRRTAGLPLLPRQMGSIAPDHPPKQLHAWNSQQSTGNSQDVLQQQPIQQSLQHSQSTTLAGAISRTPARLPEDVTALADRDNVGRDRDGNKNAVTKTYHTLKDLISSKFKKENNEIVDELNNVVVHQQPQQQVQKNGKPSEDFRNAQPHLYVMQNAQPHLTAMQQAIPSHIRQMQNLNQSQPNILASTQKSNGTRNVNPDSPRSTQQRAASQPQLNLPMFERHNSADIVTDSDDGGFATRAQINRRPQTMYHLSTLQQQPPQQQTISNSHQYLKAPTPSLSMNGTTFGQAQQQYQSFISPFQHQHLNGQAFNNTNGHMPLTTMLQSTPEQQVFTENGIGSGHIKTEQHEMTAASTIQSRQDVQRSSFQKRLQDSECQNQMQQEQQQHSSQQHQQTNQSSTSNQQFHNQNGNATNLSNGITPQMPKIQPMQRLDLRQPHDVNKPVPGSANSSDYDKSGNQSSNVDSGRGSAAYSSGRKAPQLDTESSDSPLRDDTKNDDSEWVDIVDAELRHILDPGMQTLSIRPDSTVSGSVSSMSPPLPPLSPDNSSYKLPKMTKDSSKQDYGTDSYNRPGRAAAAIGPSRAGWPGSALHKQNGSYTKSAQKFSGKKLDQAVLKRHLFGLDNDLTSNTTRSLDLESLLGGPWGTAQSVSDSETDTQGIRHIRSQLEGLEHMYGEVLKMLGTRNLPNRMQDHIGFRGIRRRHGSLSSLPSSSVSSRPIRDRKRNDDRRKVRDIKGINKRFQRLESHVVTLARSVAHLSSEMRSQHLVTQELERLRDEFAALSRAQAGRSQNLYRSTPNANTTNEPEPPNLTNPKRVKKLTKFFGEDPPLMRLFLRSLGYEKYASLFEAERVGMIELPYLGEERLQKLGVPLGPRLRILQEAQISLCKDTTLCIV